MVNRLPAIFFGHGNPLLTLSSNPYTQAWAALAASLPKPRAVLVVSAHWYGPGTRVTAMSAPPTLHDFGGFAPELYEIRYPAPGDPALAARVRDLLAPVAVTLDQAWGLDHGTWSVLRHLYPAAEVPVVQLSIDAAQPPRFHYELGRRLSPLREEGVLLIGSGNLVHNLRAYAWDRPTAPPADWAVRFEREARRLIVSGEHAALIDYQRIDSESRRVVPTPEHYLPLLYVIAQQGADDGVSFPVEGVDGGSISMLAVCIG